MSKPTVQKALQGLFFSSLRTPQPWACRLIGSNNINVVQRRCPSKVSAVQPAGYWEVSGAASGPPLERSRRFFVACKVRLMPALLPEEETMTKTVADFMLECLAADPAAPHHQEPGERSEEHTSELQSLMRISYAVFCL